MSTPSQSRQSANKSSLETHNRDQVMGLIYGLIGVLIFSGTLPATRFAIATFDPWFLTFGRALLATSTSILLMILLKRRFPHGHVRALVISGLLLVFGFPGCVAMAMTTVPSSHGGVVLGILPMATAFFASLWAGEKPSFLFWVCGVVGTVLTVVFALRDGGWGFATGDFWLLAAVACASAGYVMAAKLSRIMPGWEVISWSLIFTAPLSLIGTLWLWKTSYANPALPDLLALLYLGFGSMYLGFFAWNSGLQRGGVARVSQLQLLQTFFTLAIAALLLGEKITPVTLLFAGLIVLVILVGRRAQVAKT